MHSSFSYEILQDSLENYLKSIFFINEEDIYEKFKNIYKEINFKKGIYLTLNGDWKNFFLSLIRYISQ